MAERYKQEIEEILKQAGDLGTGPRRARPGLLGLVWLQVVQAVGGKTWSVKPGRVMLVALALLLTALIGGAFVQGAPVAILAWGGLVLFIVGYAMFFVRPPTIEKRWRGESIEYGGDSWWDRLRRKIK